PGRGEAIGLDPVADPRPGGVADPLAAPLEAQAELDLLARAQRAAAPPEAGVEVAVAFESRAPEGHVGATRQLVVDQVVRLRPAVPDAQIGEKLRPHPVRQGTGPLRVD